MPKLSLHDKLLIIDKLADGGVTNLSLLGGEPLTLGDELFAILKRAKERQINISVVTNGTLLNRDISHRLIDDGLAYLVVSVLMQPQTLHFIKINQMGELIWNTIDGHHTTDEIVASTVQLYVDVYAALDKTCDKDEICLKAAAEIKSFILSLKDQHFIEFSMSSTDCLIKT